jgi:hypothetical protein
MFKSKTGKQSCGARAEQTHAQPHQKSVPKNLEKSSSGRP